MAADISFTASNISSTEGSNQPTNSTSIGANLDDNLRAIQAHYAALRDVTGWGGLRLTSVAGTNTITGSVAAQGSVTMSPAAYATGMRFTLIPANSNTGAATLNVDSIGAKSIFLNGAALVGYELRKNCPVELYYDGTQFNIVAGAHGGDGIPIGTESNRYFATAPNGQLLCDGTAVSRSTYADLFAVLSTTWGAGDGSTTFNLPSMARRASVGSGGTGTSTLANTVGSTGGAETHALSTAETPAHTHTFRLGGVSGSPLNFPLGGNTDNADFTTPSGGGSGGAHNNMQPSAVVYKCIKY